MDLTYALIVVAVVDFMTKLILFFNVLPFVRRFNSRIYLTQPKSERNYR